MVRPGTLMVSSLLALNILTLFFKPVSAETNPAFYVKTTLYQDWMGFKIQDAEFYNRISSRLKLTLWNRPGEGWTVALDVRDRYTFTGNSENQLLIYKANITYDDLHKNLYFSVGQMNLYDTGGVGELAGGILGIRLNRNLDLGAYAGIQPDIYNTRWETDYLKYGLFARYLGPKARQFSIGYNLIRYAGETERHFITARVLLPLPQILMVYGNLEYDLDPKVSAVDRLSQLFVNLRLNLTRYADLTGHYSSGRGLDYHEFLLEQSMNPSLENQDIDRYYYNSSYGLRFSLKPVSDIRIYAERRESEKIDQGIHNHTTRLGFSVINIFDSGTSFFGYYNLNRGEESESDSYYVSASRSFGKLSVNLSYANFYNATRMIDDSSPELLHLANQQTLTTDFFFIVNKSLALSLEYAYTMGEDLDENQFFVRLIYRR